MANIDILMGKLVERLDEYRPDQVEAIRAMQKTIKDASLKQNFKEHPAMKALLETLSMREKGYTLVLANKEDLDAVKRAAFFARRQEVRFFLAFFDVDASLESLEQALERELEEQLGGG